METFIIVCAVFISYKVLKKMLLKSYKKGCEDTLKTVKDEIWNSPLYIDILAIGGNKKAMKEIRYMSKDGNADLLFKELTDNEQLPRR